MKDYLVELRTNYMLPIQPNNTQIILAFGNRVEGTRLRSLGFGLKAPVSCFEAFKIK